MTSRQLPLDLALPQRLGRADFLPAPSNTVALTAVGAPGGWPAGRMLIVGPRGCGRSHLAAIFAAETGAPLLTGGALSLPHPAQAYVVDDADAVAGDPDREEALFHLYNRAEAAGAPLLLTARGTPGTWGLRLPDLESRMLSVATTRLERPDDDLLRMVLVKLFDERGLAVEDGVLDFLLKRIDRSLAHARDVVDALDRAALSRHRSVSRPFAKETLDALAGSSHV